MRRYATSGLLALLVFLLAMVSAVHAEGHSGHVYIVQQGDTLFSIARRFGVSIRDLAAANGIRWNAWVYVGQRLIIPTGGAAGRSSGGTGVYVVQPGDTLFSIARRHGTSVAALQAANGLRSTLIYVGQRLVIPGNWSPASSKGNEAQPAPSSASSSSRPTATGDGEKWIDVNLTTQTLTAYEGTTPVFRTSVSTGTARYPTVEGTFHIYVKLRTTRMRGGSGADAYDLPNVPYVMYFYRGYALHGTYWHNNFGTPMSHGCVNLSIPDAEWLYNWADVGTKVVTHR